MSRAAFLFRVLMMVMAAVLSARREKAVDEHRNDNNDNAKDDRSHNYGQTFEESILNKKYKQQIVKIRLNLLSALPLSVLFPSE